MKSLQAVTGDALKKCRRLEVQETVFSHGRAECGEEKSLFLCRKWNFGHSDFAQAQVLKEFGLRISCPYEDKNKFQTLSFLQLTIYQVFIYLQYNKLIIQVLIPQLFKQYKSLKSSKQTNVNGSKLFKFLCSYFAYTQVRSLSITLFVCLLGYSSVCNSFQQKENEIFIYFR